MLKAKDFRYYAREALRGRWLNAGGAALVAGLLGASINLNVSSGNFNSGNSESVNEIVGGSVLPSEETALLLAVLMGVVLVLLLWAIVTMIIGGATTIGYAKYNLNLVDDKEPKIQDIISEYHRLGTGFGMQFFRGLFIFLWSLLLVIPGIMAAYSYYMTPFILAENPEMTAREAIRESKALMKGNRWRLFCLEISFIGWTLLAVISLCVVTAAISVPMFIGSSRMTVIVGIAAMIVIIIAYCIIITMTLSPYIQAATAVFYREIKDGKYSNPQVEGTIYDDPYAEKTFYSNPYVE